jgi:hypothetical protein
MVETERRCSDVGCLRLLLLGRVVNGGGGGVDERMPIAASGQSGLHNFFTIASHTALERLCD